MNFKVQVTNAINSLTADVSGLTALDNLVRRFGVGYVLATQGDALKTKSKNLLKNTGVIPGSFTPGETLDLSDAKSKFKLLAVTSQPRRVLSVLALADALKREDLPLAMRTRILAGAMQDAAPATTFKIEQR